MNVREVGRKELPAELAVLVPGNRILALVPQTTDLAWCAAVAWEVARAAASHYRSVTLVDLCLTDPVLAAGAEGDVTEGIVDILTYGASISRVVSEQPGGIRLITTGTYPTSPESIITHERLGHVFTALADGGNVTFALVPPEYISIARVSFDGILLLSPTGHQPGIQQFAPVNAVLARGIPALAAITDIPSPADEIPEDDARLVPTEHPKRDSGSYDEATDASPGSGRYAGIAIAIAVVVALVFLFRGQLGLTGGSGSQNDATNTPGFTAPAAPVASAPEADTVSSVTPETRPAAETAQTDEQVDSPASRGSEETNRAQGRAAELPYSVQYAAMTIVDSAAAMADRLQDLGHMGFVAPVRVDGRTFYRVLVGALPSQNSADSVIQTMRDRGFRGGGAAVARLTPLTFRVATGLDESAARARLAGLREAGTPGYILMAADGLYQVLVGAFRSAEQAELADSLLSASGLSTTIITRTGIY